MAFNIEDSAEGSLVVKIVLSFSRLNKVKNGGYTSLLPPGIDPLLADTIRDLDHTILTAINDGQAINNRAPFQPTIKADAIPCGQKKTVQVCGSTTVLELAHAIDCELGIDAQRQRLVLMGKTLYNWGYHRGMLMEGYTLRSVCCFTTLSTYIRNGPAY